MQQHSYARGRKPVSARPGSPRALSSLLVVLLLVLLPASAAAAESSWRKPTDTTIYSVAASGDGQHLIAGTRDNRLLAYDRAGELRWEYQTQGTVYGTAVSHDGNTIAAASEDRHAYALDGTGKLLWKERGTHTFNAVAVSADGAIIAAGSEDRQIYLFDRDGHVLWKYLAENAVNSLAVYGGRDAFRVVLGTSGSRVSLLSGEGQLLWSQTLSYAIRSVDATADGRAIIVGEDSGKVHLLDGANGALRWSYAADSSARSVAISDDGALAAAGTDDGALLIFDAAGNLAQQQELATGIRAIALVPVTLELLISSDQGLALLERGPGGTYALAQPASLLLPAVGGALAIVLTGLALLGARRRPDGTRAWHRSLQRGRSVGQALWRNRLSYAFLLPTLALLLLFNYYPAISGIAHAFTSWTPGVETRWTGLQNFRAMIADRYLWVGTGNVIILILTSFAKLAMPLLVAELIVHLRNSRLQYLMRTVFVVPLIVPSVVAILLWVNIYDPNIGLANRTLQALGLDHMTRVWLGDESTALWAIVFMNFPWVSAFALLIFYGGLISIPAELFDAAQVDGASGLRRFWSIDLPLLLGQIRLLMILAFIAGVQEFAAIFLTTGGGPGSATYVPALELYYQAVRFNNFGLASAIGAVLFLVILGGTIFSMRYIKSAVEYSA